MLNQQGRSLSEFNGMPFPHPPETAQRIARVRQHEMDLMSDPIALSAQVLKDMTQRNPQQSAVFDTVVSAIDQPSHMPKLFFLYASGGCGKTFLLNLLLRHVRASVHIATHANFDILYFIYVIVSRGMFLGMVQLMSKTLEIFQIVLPKTVDLHNASKQ